LISKAILAEQFYGYKSFVSLVVGFVDGTHAPLSKTGDDLVTTKNDSAGFYIERASFLLDSQITIADWAATDSMYPKIGETMA
jgi:hypothetical protein